MRDKPKCDLFIPSHQDCEGWTGIYEKSLVLKTHLLFWALEVLEMLVKKTIPHE